MNEIKLRAWDKKNKIMMQIDDLYWFEETGVHGFDGSGMYSDYIFIQYTGLNDKDGADIYDRDIISDGHFIWEVYFKDGCFRVALKSHNNKVADRILLVDILKARTVAKMPIYVIGNICKSPKLLERDNDKLS